MLIRLPPKNGGFPMMTSKPPQRLTGGITNRKDFGKLELPMKRRNPLAIPCAISDRLIRPRPQLISSLASSDRPPPRPGSRVVSSSRCFAFSARKKAAIAASPLFEAGSTRHLRCGVLLKLRIRTPYPALRESSFDIPCCKVDLLSDFCLQKALLRGRCPVK